MGIAHGACGKEVSRETGQKSAKKMFEVARTVSTSVSSHLSKSASDWASPLCPPKRLLPYGIGYSEMLLQLWGSKFGGLPGVDESCMGANRGG